MIHLKSLERLILRSLSDKTVWKSSKLLYTVSLTFSYVGLAHNTLFILYSSVSNSALFVIL